MIDGRMPIHIWPRPLMWAFEWYDTNKPLVLKRGEPWFYLHFETSDPSRRVRMVEAEMTPALGEYLSGLQASRIMSAEPIHFFGRPRSGGPKNCYLPSSANKKNKVTRERNTFVGYEERTGYSVYPL